MSSRNGHAVVASGIAPRRSAGEKTNVAGAGPAEGEDAAGAETEH